MSEEYVLPQIASEVELAIRKALSSVQTVNGEKPDENGNVTIALPAVRYTPQELTPEEQAQVRANIGAAAVGEGGGDETPSEAVLYVKQDLAEEQQAQARDNIGALAKNFGIESAGAQLVVGVDGNVIAYGVEQTSVLTPVRTYEKGVIYAVESNKRLFVTHNQSANVSAFQVYAGRTYRFKGASLTGATHSYALANAVYDRPDNNSYNTGAIFTIAKQEATGGRYDYEIVPSADCYLYVQTAVNMTEDESKVYEVTGIVENFDTTYTVADDGNGIEISYPYGDDRLTVQLNKRGGNNLFDFRKISTKTASLFNSASSDWHSPFIVAAVNNADGDAPNSSYFTGGNHQTNNTGTGGAATARTSQLQFYANGKLLASGKSGKAERIEMRWTNMVQGYNTSKADGSGREILQENHTLTFVNGKFEAYVEIIPLEDVTMHTYYGLQGIMTSVWSNIRYPGGANRAVYTGASESGDSTTFCMDCYGDAHKMRIEIDPNLDLGKRTADFASGTKGAFSTDYGKCYFTIVNKTVSMTANSMYCLRGSYMFTPI